MKKINLAIIGCGRISYRHIQAAVDNINQMVLVAVCDTQKEKAQEKSYLYSKKVQDLEESNVEKANVNIYEDYKEMLEKEQIDLVSICTESGYHTPHALYCMNKGKHVLVEKPMALSTGDAEDMIECARENNVKLCVSHQNRFNPPIQKLRKALDDNRFGKLIAGSAKIYWNRDQEYYSQANWRGTYELDGGCLMNQCIHNIDLLQWLLGGEIVWINGETNNYSHSYIEAEDYGSIQIKFANGAVGNVEGTICIYPKNLEETLTIIGEKGIVSIGGLAVNKIETWRFADEMDTEDQMIRECNADVENVYGSGHTPLYMDFIDAIKSDRKPYIDGEDGKKAMEIILTAYKSSRDGKRIYYPPGEISSIDFK